MARFLLFCSGVLLLVTVSGLSVYQGLPIDNTSFDLEKHRKREKKPRSSTQVSALHPPPARLVSKGEKLYAKCIACHGARGEGKKSQKAPKISGQHTWYIVSSLEAMKSRKRKNKVMFPYVRGLSEEDFQELALYISELSPALK